MDLHPGPESSGPVMQVASIFTPILMKPFLKIRDRFVSLSGIAFSLLAALSIASPVHAFAVSPVLFDITADPSTKQQGIIHVTNDTNAEQTYYADVQNFVPHGEEGQQSFMPETDTSGLVSWITLEETSVKLKVGEGKDFRWALQLPPNAEPGGHYAAIFFSTIPPKTIADTGVGVGAKTGVLFLVNVNGNIKESAAIESFHVASEEMNGQTVSPASFMSHLPAYFETRIRNDGNVHFVPRGDIKITGMFGSASGEIPVNPANSRVLPNSIRRIVSEWGPQMDEPKTLWDGVRAEWNGFAFGRYTAHLAATYGSKDTPLTASVTFWVIPWRLMILAILAIILLLCVLKGYNRMVIRSAMSKGTKK